MNDEQRVYQDMTPEQRRCFLAALMEQYVISFPYFSKIILSAPQALAGPFTYTVLRGTNVRAFSYAFNSGDAVSGGFPATYTATEADTNLAKAQETNAGESVEIYGMAIQPVPSFVRDVGGLFQTDILSDGRFLALCADAVSVTLLLNAGREGYKMGIIPMIPGGGGIEGSGFDSLGTQAVPGGRPQFGFFTNGRPEIDNVFEMFEGMVWLPAGNRDSMLNLRFLFERNVIAYSGGQSQINVTDEAGAAGIRGYTYPDDIGVALMVYLKGKTVSERSNVT